MEDTTHSIAIIGLGNIGYRHLQSLNSITNYINLFIVEPNPSAIQRLQSTFGKEISSSNRNLVILNNYKSLPKRLNLVIVATSSDIRFQIFEYLIENIHFDSLILEKVLFNKTNDYESSLKLNPSVLEKVFVNCPRPYYPSYIEFKKRLSNLNVKKIEVIGTNWNFASNLIHFISLISFLLDSVEYKYGKFVRIEKLRKSKRENFHEFDGKFQFNLKNCLCEISCHSNSDSNNEIELNITTDNECFSINETNQIIQIFNNNHPLAEFPFRIEYQSVIGSRVINDLLSNKCCNLPNLLESIKQHQLFIQDLSYFFKNNGFGDGLCPIT